MLRQPANGERDTWTLFVRMVLALARRTTATAILALVIVHLPRSRETAMVETETLKSLSQDRPGNWTTGWSTCRDAVIVADDILVWESTRAVGVRRRPLILD